MKNKIINYTCIIYSTRMKYWYFKPVKMTISTWKNDVLSSFFLAKQVVFVCLRCLTGAIEGNNKTKIIYVYAWWIIRTMSNELRECVWLLALTTDKSILESSVKDGLTNVFITETSRYKSYPSFSTYLVKIEEIWGWNKNDKLSRRGISNTHPQHVIYGDLWVIKETTQLLSCLLWKLYENGDVHVMWKTSSSGRKGCYFLIPGCLIFHSVWTKLTFKTELRIRTNWGRCREAARFIYMYIN